MPYLAPILGAGWGCIVQRSCGASKWLQPKEWQNDSICARTTCAYRSHSFIPHISLSCTVCDREMWVSVKFTINFPKMLKHNERGYICTLSGLGQSWLSIIINILGKILTANPTPFSNICPRYARRADHWWVHYVLVCQAPCASNYLTSSFPFL